MYVHGDNLTQKENHTTKYLCNTSKQYLEEIREQYNIWKDANLALIGPLKAVDTANDFTIIQERVQLFSTYKDFLDQQHYAEHFDSRSNLHSSVLEEFMYYLFKDLINEFSEDALIGKSRAFKDIFFQSKSYEEMVTSPNVNIEIKDHDFVIGTKIITQMNCNGKTNIQTEELQIPAVAIECKTYLDKTMLEGSSKAGEQLLMKNPNALYIVVSEWLKLTEKVNLKKYTVDQIFVLRKQKNTDREFRYDPNYEKKPIHDDVVDKLFNMVRDHLINPWEGTIQDSLRRGYLI